MDEPASILIVDDLPEKLLVYRTILDELGQELVTAGSGEEALRAVLDHDFAVILLDVNMPGLNGLETAAMIRKRKRSAHTPIIFLTAFSDEMRAAEGYALGAVDFITTPVVPDVLRAKARVFADLYRLNQQVKRQADERIALAEERTRREAAEEANSRLAFLTHAGAVLGGSLDQDVIAREAVRLALSYLADTAALATVTADYSPESRVIRGWVEAGGPVLQESIGRDSLDPELWDAIQRAAVSTFPVTGAPSLLAVPVHTRGHVVAVLGLSRLATGKPYSSADVSIAESFASRVAMALENARLYFKVQKADHQKNEFLSMLAHELRNPLAPIRSANEVLHLSGSDPGRVQWAHGVIDRQLTHLVRLVDDLLDVSRLTLGKIRLAVEDVDLKTVLVQAVEAAHPMIDKYRHHLEIALLPEPMRVVGDPARLTQVFANLLNNAAKYTEPGGRISVTASLHMDPGGQSRDGESAPLRDSAKPVSSLVEIRVRDTGVGIAADVLPTVFDLFTQANRSLDRSQGGLGVGLTIVRRLVEMHGGFVEAHSEGPGRGSEFVVCLPATSSPPRHELDAPVAAAESQSQVQPLRIVLVDDNTDGVESMADLISLLGHHVRTAHDGPTGIRVVGEFDPDIVLLDIGLPGMDGYEVARRLRYELRCRATLVAISGYGRDEDRALSRKAGCVEHFVKPVESHTLRALFASILSTSAVTG